jgi:hypothetical protein
MLLVFSDDQCHGTPTCYRDGELDGSRCNDIVFPQRCMIPTVLPPFKNTWLQSDEDLVELITQLIRLQSENGLHWNQIGTESKEQLQMVSIVRQYKKNVVFPLTL